MTDNSRYRWRPPRWWRLRRQLAEIVKQTQDLYERAYRAGLDDGYREGLRAGLVKRDR